MDARCLLLARKALILPSAYTHYDCVLGEKCPYKLESNPDYRANPLVLYV